MFRGTLEVSADAFATILAHYGIGEPHITMQPEPVSRSLTETERALAAAKAEFGRYGFIGGDGRLDGGVRDTLNCSVRPEIEYYGWFQVRGRTTAVLACALEAEALIAVRDGDRIRMRRITPAGLVDELIGTLPALPPARFTPISMRLTEARTALSGQSSGGYLQPVATNRGGSPARQIKELTSREEIGGGQLSVAVRDWTGNRMNCAFALRVVDNPEGRIINMISEKGNGDNWLLVAPGTPQEVHKRLLQMTDALPSR